MNRYLSYLFHIILPALLMTACSGNDGEQAKSRALVLSIPVSVYSESNLSIIPQDSRGTGDPGVTEQLPSPRYLYLWLDMVDAGGNARLLYEEASDIQAIWVRKTDDPDRWECVREVKLPEGWSLKDGSTLQVYAIATQHALDASFLTGLTTLSAVRAATFDLASWQNATAADHSYALGNIYSTPLALMGSGNADAAAAGIATDLLSNGTYVVQYDADKVRLIGQHPTRLYHCAAKADFKWEVDEPLRPVVSVSAITVIGLPTKLKVFEPTHNPAGTATCPLLAASGAVNDLTTGNKWVGREYAYVLQRPTTTSPADGELPYTADFVGRTPDSKNHIASQSLSATNPVFTTWYRVNADIK